MATKDAQDQLVRLLATAKKLARQYRELTGKPLGITGEVAEYEAARLLGLKLTVARQAGYDATGKVKGRERRFQIKGRCVLPGCGPGQRLGSINKTKDWDAVLLILLDQDMNALSIHEADRKPVIAALEKPGSRARNERGALSVNSFKRIGRQVWPALSSEARGSARKQARA